MREVREYESTERPRYGSPPVAYRRGGSDRSFQAYVSGALGWSDRIRGRFSGEAHRRGTEPVRSILLGVTLEESMLALPIIGWPR